jgi:hypothetical protein
MNDVSNPELLLITGTAEIVVLALLCAAVVIWAVWGAVSWFQQQRQQRNRKA